MKVLRKILYCALYVGGSGFLFRVRSSVGNFFIRLVSGNDDAVITTGPAGRGDWSVFVLEALLFLKSVHLTRGIHDIPYKVLYIDL